MSAFTTIVYLFVALLAAYVVAFMFKAIKTNNIQKEVDLYREMLNSARTCRIKFVEMVEATRQLSTRENALSMELITQKKIIIGIRENLRKLMIEIRQLGSSSGRQSALLDNKVNTKKKAIYGQVWKFYNSKKLDINVIKSEYTKLNQQLKAMILEEKATEKQWNSEREAVMKLFGNLKKEWNNIKPPNFSGTEVVFDYKKK